MLIRWNADVWMVDYAAGYNLLPSPNYLLIKKRFPHHTARWAVTYLVASGSIILYMYKISWFFYVFVLPEIKLPLLLHNNSLFVAQTDVSNHPSRQPVQEFTSDLSLFTHYQGRASTKKYSPQIVKEKIYFGSKIQQIWFVYLFWYQIIKLLTMFPIQIISHDMIYVLKMLFNDTCWLVWKNIFSWHGQHFRVHFSAFYKTHQYFPGFWGCFISWKISDSIVIWELFSKI